jgi:hypothetical protein
MQHVSDCDMNAIFGISSNKNRNLDQFLSKSDAIGLVSDQFKVVTYLGGGPLLTVLRVLSKMTGGSKRTSAMSQSVA